MLRFTVQKLCFVLAVGALAMVALPALADQVSDVLTIYNAKGGIYQQVFVTEQQESNSSNTVWYIPITSPNLVDYSQIGHATELVEAGGAASDYFGVYAPQGVFGLAYLGFTSDADPSAAVSAFGTPTIIINPEIEGHPYDATPYLSSTLRAARYTATFVSGVPEPVGIVGILSMGAMGLIGFVWRRRQA